MVDSWSMIHKILLNHKILHQKRNCRTHKIIIYNWGTYSDDDDDDDDCGSGHDCDDEQDFFVCMCAVLAFMIYRRWKCLCFCHKPHS
jgi:hypothetical protein